MLAELVVTNLGVIDRAEVVLGEGMTVFTGETGAGKTLLVQAINLLTGGRADGLLVGSHGDEAHIEGRFVVGDIETVVARAIPRTGRSRAYVDGRMATAARLAEVGADHVDLHGQHEHQSLLRRSIQRAALDGYGGVDLSELRGAYGEIRDLTAQLDSLGGDDRARAHELDLVRFQVDELSAAELQSSTEDDDLAREEQILANATTLREAAGGARQLLAGDGGAQDTLGAARSVTDGLAGLESVSERLRAVGGELDDIATELRVFEESVADDPDRLAAIGKRRALLSELRRKYGDTIADVIEFRDASIKRQAELATHDIRASELEAELAVARATSEFNEKMIAEQRRAAAPDLAAAVNAHLGELAMDRARFEVTVDGDGPADDVEFRIDANESGAALPLTKVASGGELARVMLALRLVLTAGPPTLVFDEVDAGVGGTAAGAVGRALAGLTDRHQVLAVTHLPQVAAHSDHHVVVTKHDGDVVRSSIANVDGDERVVEISRMLSGQPHSKTARQHAAELLAGARR